MRVSGIPARRWIALSFVAATLGLAVVLLYVRRLRKPAVATTTPAPEIDEKYRKQIEADLAEME